MIMELLKSVTKAFEAYQHIPELKVEPHFVKTNFGSS